MIYFFSDVHLGLYSRQDNLPRESLLLQFLKAIENDCETLIIVGDLFDYWFEYKYVIPKYYYRIITALKDLRLKNIKIEYLMGNHDFGHKTFFKDELDIFIHKNDIQRTFGNKKFYITHGDGKNYHDTGYKILKKILRNPFAQWLYGLLHPDIAIGLASKSSKKSRKYTAKKQWGEGDGFEDFAKLQFSQGFDYVIVGHRHKPTFKKIDNGTFVDLGSWLGENPTFAMFDGNELTLNYVKEFLSKKF
ncbi:UDP-2,3-diacylglucosamine diphosphatase [Bacteroidetes/Chlorobi group bacterium ChocPot_Mid]|jgi:UDP-2,3-diacylglucosamine hydrolase|nr:MAG: UDP-2,3-diacylglucosamine diphosphatase [Bacteroidetes/Chlorobi group bacterium ChocPot_Mid]